MFISNVELTADSKDTWKWKATKDGEFTTKSAYSILEASNTESHSPQLHIEALSNVWDVPAPHKARVTAWRCLRNRLATCDNLVKRQVVLDTVERRCNACFSSEETADHLFLFCPKAVMVWDSIQRWLGVQTVRPGNVAQHFTSFFHLGREKKSKKVLKALWIGTVWLLWKKRNESRFDGEVWEVSCLVLEVKGRLWSWIKIFNLHVVEVDFGVWCSHDFVLSSCIKF
ncbi:uncharacterized protein LOC130998010 [Salvia miltiorrhiza]|uniref:uncharacterized protein LOC130998010 n=1 Tax=Salvia miltiorrhiza TaxID=226208 RepID=UPI0025AC4924|nr:uncharacterized protein LOC130998010 [Salvia miltiorrhiza]